MINNKYHSSLYANGSLLSPGTFPQFSLNTVNDVAYYHIYCKHNNKYIWGLKNLITNIPTLDVIVSTLGTPLDSDYKVEY